MTENRDPLDRIETAIAFREEDPDGPQVVTISTHRAAALVAVARAAREAEEAMERMDAMVETNSEHGTPEWFQAAVTNLTETLARLDRSAEGGAR